MISVERVLEYTRLPMEADLESKEDKKPKPTWPHIGGIKAHNVCLRYAPTSPLVLKDLTFIINGKEKVLRSFVYKSTYTYKDFIF